MSTWETLEVRGEGEVRTLLLNRPQARNAVNQQMLMELADACTWLDRQAQVRLVVLRGAGPTFCAGADLKEGTSQGGSLAPRMSRSRLGTQAINAIANLGAVTLAVVQGHAIGGGACLAAACDFRLGAQNALVSLRESSLGLSLSWNSIPNIVHLLGVSRAKEMILFGELHPADTLLAWGFFNEVTPEAELEREIERWTQRVLKQPPLPVRMGKASINALVKALDQSVFHMDEIGLGLTGGTRDAEKARKAYFDGDSPDWEGE